MWIFMNDAFLSIVAHREKAHTMLVRARIEGDIERVFPDAKVKRTENADYLFRAEINTVDVLVAISNEVASIDYDNFKASIPHDDDERHWAYLEVWKTMHRCQNGWNLERITRRYTQPAKENRHEHETGN